MDALAQERAAVSALETQLAQVRGKLHKTEEGVGGVDSSQDEDGARIRSELQAVNQERGELREGQRLLHVEMSKSQRDLDQEKKLNARYLHVMEMVEALSLIHI
eukprot:TRINITY_DN24702_c0_g1_i1.p1 TRINITY_DN24702_c0_g1~~TRINITY_DN24702_c0_g1_i1.p1  ORF type:complete len:104 (-),score=24.35 TRINITY_DN24702_c0_g1_i1:45-356(-)